MNTTPPSLLLPLKCDWDNCCSYSLSNSTSLFSSLFPLPLPLPIGGVGGNCLATHAGYLSCLPSTNYMNFALFSPTAPQTLLSLGHLHACGGTFITTLNPPILQIRSADGTVLDNSRLLSHSNLYPANLPTLLSVLHKLPHLTAVAVEQNHGLIGPG